MTDAIARIRQVRALFDAAMDRPADERAAYLDLASGSDHELRNEVARMLTVSTETAGALMDDVVRFSEEGESDSLVGQRLGQYQIVRLVGRGGMGSVYEAVRADDQYQKRVAIKLVQSGLTSELTLARFRQERQILARLEHKNIAALYDGGVAPDGRPFLVMEFIEGEPITTWCDERRLRVQERLSLLRQVCAAVQHAHSNLVIHRDLKPGNILVTSDGTVKLLDFGIAKLLDESQDADGAPLTRVGARALTPEYASPEQLRGDPLTATSDVYSLGVVLYELLAGRRPHIASGQSLAQLERAVLESSVPQPSSVLTDAVAAQRRERSASTLRRELRGDLDALAMMALRVEPERRYPLAVALGDDIRRWLDGRPVTARPDSVMYRAGKFARRNAAVLIATALLFVALVSGVIMTTREAHRANAAMVRAERVSGFLSTLLATTKPASEGRDVTVAEVLDSAASRMSGELADDPDTRAGLESVIGWSYLNLGRDEDALKHMQSELALTHILEGASGPRTANALNNVGIANMHLGNLDVADSLLHLALTMHRAVHAPTDSTLAAILGNLGSIAHSKGNDTEAERWHRQALAVKTELSGPQSDAVAQSMLNLAVTLGGQDRWADAESLARKALAITRANHRKPDHLQAAILNLLATGLDLQGKTLAADSAYRAVLDLRRQLLGPKHPDVAFTLSNYSGFAFDQHHYEQAEAMSREILAMRGTTLPDKHPIVAAALLTLGKCLDQKGDHAGALSALKESLALRKSSLPPGSWAVGSAEGVLGEHFIIVHDYRAAEPLLLHADSTLRAALGGDSGRTRTNVKRLVALYTAWGKPDEAAVWSARLAPAPPH